MSATSPNNTADPAASEFHGTTGDVASENEILRDKLDRIAETLRIWRSDLPADATYRTIVHDVRNLVNEVVLLRQIADLGDDEENE